MHIADSLALRPVDTRTHAERDAERETENTRQRAAKESRLARAGITEAEAWEALKMLDASGDAAAKQGDARAIALALSESRRITKILIG